MDFFHPEEAVSLRGISFRHLNQNWLEDQRLDWARFWNEYLLTGGIPHAVGCQVKKGNIPDSIWRVYLDWILGTWSKLRTSERSLAALARRICETMNSRVSYEALKKGTDIQSANTVKTLLDLQEDHF